MIYRRKKNQKIEFCSESNAQNSKASHQNHINPQKKNTSNSPALTIPRQIHEKMAIS